MGQRLKGYGDEAARSYSVKGGSFRGTHVMVYTMIRMAYNLFDYQIQGGPSWLESDTYDVLAKPDGDANQDQVKLMVQTLLADRFRLAFHRDTNEVAGYAIVVAKKGPKLHTSDADRRPKKEIGRWFVSGQAITIDSLASSLAHILRCPVSDKSGLKGVYDFRLEWTPEGSAQASEPGLSVFTAMESQLGLKLEREKVPVEALVIDHIERPSGN